MSGDPHVERRGDVRCASSSQGLATFLKSAEVEETRSVIEGIYKVPIAISKQHLGAFAKAMVSTSKILNSPSDVCGHKLVSTPNVFASVFSPVSVNG
jgi:hypothetical protein